MKNVTNGSGNDTRRIYNEEEYNTFVEQYPEFDTIDRKIFNMDRVDYATITPEGCARDPQWKVRFIDINGQKATITSTQMFNLLLLYYQYRYTLATLGLGDWNGQIIKKLNFDNIVNFNEMNHQFLPKLLEPAMVKDPFYRIVMKESFSSIDQNRRNFLGSKASKSCIFMDRERRYIIAKKLENMITEEEAAGIAEEFYLEELEKHGHKTATPIDRKLITEAAQKRLLEKTGYKYLMTELDIDTVWFDEDVIKICEYMLPDLYEALQEIEKMIHINSQENAMILNTEDTNPICKTNFYQNSCVQSFNSMVAMLHIDPSRNNSNMKFEDFLYKNIYEVVSNTNELRKVTYKNDCAFHVEEPENLDYNEEREIAIDKITKDIINCYHSRINHLRMMLKPQYFAKLKI